MSGLEMAMVLLFVVPMAAACAAFMLGALWMQVKEEQKREAQAQQPSVRRRARRAAYHTAQIQA